MAPEEKSKAIKGLCLAAIIGLPFVLIANIRLSPEAVNGLRDYQAKMAAGPANSSMEADEQANSADVEETEAQKIADGTHCISGWDLSLPALKTAVKEQLRNPRSFEHIKTSWSHMGKDGKFGLIMKYRAENGFGGLNVESIGVLVDAKTCDFKEVSATTLAKRAIDDPTTS